MEIKKKKKRRNGNISLSVHLRNFDSLLMLDFIISHHILWNYYRNGRYQ